MHRTLIAGLIAAGPAALAPAQEAFDTIAFGSCAREREPQPIWTEIIAQQPDLFLFIGDNQYADLWMKDGRMVMEPVESVARIEQAYDELGAKPGYRRMQRTCPILATWDDHDYGANDAGADFPLKQESQEAYLDFFGFRENSPIRDQAGIYHSRVFTGPSGEVVRIIMLDTRFHRDALETGPRSDWGGGRYLPTDDASKTILGERQWRWLAEQLLEPADVRIIASSIQVVADEHRYETWGNFPHERRRLYELIDETRASGVLIVSGDRHLMEISRDTERGAPYPIWDFTSSGLTQRPSPVDEPNPHRVGPVKRETNFGVIRFDWADPTEDTAIHLEGYGDRGQLLTRQTVWLGDLRE